MNYSRRLENVLQQINLNKTIYKNFQNISFLKKPVQIMRNCVKILLIFTDFLQSIKEKIQT